MPESKAKSAKKDIKDSSVPTGRVGKYHYAVGKRKTSVATVRLYEKGKGNFHVNGKTLEDFANSKDLVEVANASLRLVKMLKDYDITIQVKGGGFRGQIDAIKHGISRALIVANPELRTSIKKAGYLTRDSRIKERKKFGLKKARKSPQWSKR